MLQTIKVDGEFWFLAGYAASLLKTTTHKIEAMAIRGIIRWRQDGDLLYIAEADVTRLRRDKSELKKLKEAVKMPIIPRPSEKMPSNTAYVGQKREALKVRQRIGAPLKDQGHS